MIIDDVREIHRRTSEMMLDVRIATNNRTSVSVMAGRIGPRYLCSYRRSSIGTEPLAVLSAASSRGRTVT